MCNHFQNIPGAEKFLPTRREFIGLDVQLQLPPYANGMWPEQQGLVLRVDEGQMKADAMMWGVPCACRGNIRKRATELLSLSKP